MRVRAVRWVASDPFPGLVEVRLLDANGSEHALLDKCSIFDDADRLGPTSAYPIELAIACRVVTATDTTVTIELEHHVEATDGRRTFVVSRSSLV